ncbi:uncharacterized protein LOC132754861 isoform X4 [Ruditapes philippinarum]|nr:uncharacterized protein LOC132754861 isoform X4 [Ruditapes philippinarum]
MADKYYRLVCFVVDICADVLRKYFVKLAKADAGNTSTSVNAYLGQRHRDVNQLLQHKKIRRYQYDLLYPSHGTADENQWDVSILVILIRELFATRLQPLEIFALEIEIPWIRNKLQHHPNTGNISNDDFDDYWGRLDSSVRLLAKNALDTNDEASLQRKINEVKCNHLPNLSDCQRIWHEETSKQLLDCLNEVHANAEETTFILRQVTVQKPGPSGDKNKRIKVADDILARLQAGFESTMKELTDDFNPPNEVTDIRTNLRDCHHVVVTGCNNSRYFETALAAVKGMDYNHKRSVEMHTSSDWRHIDPEDVDLVLCKDPFGRISYDESKAKAMEDIFTSMKHSTKSDNGDKALDIVMVTDLKILQECKMRHDHEILDEVVKVFTDTSASQPADLIIGCGSLNQYAQSSFVSKNLVVMTKNFLREYQVFSLQVDANVLKTAKEKFKTGKAVVLTGHKKSGKTSVAVALASAYESSQCLLLKEPNDVNYIDLTNICLVIIDEFAGKYRYEENGVYKWYNMFDHLYRAVIAENFNVVITCEKGNLEKCINEIGRHAILDHVVEIPLQTTVIKSEVTERLEHGHMYGPIVTTDHSIGTIPNTTQSKNYPPPLSVVPSQGPILLPISTENTSLLGIQNPMQLKRGLQSELPTETTDLSVKRSKSMLTGLWSVEEKREINIKINADSKNCFINGSCLLPSGEILLTDNINQKLKKLDNMYNVKCVCDLPDQPYDVCYVGDNVAVVSLWLKLQFVDTKHSMKLIRSIDTDHECYGLACHGDQMYVRDDYGSVYSYSTDGIKQQMIYSSRYSGVIAYKIITVSNDGSKLYLPSRIQLVTIDNNGNSLFTLNNLGTKWSCGVCVDDQGYIYVMCNNGNITQISEDGRTILQAITNVSGIIWPYSLTFDRKNKALIATGWSNKITVFKMRKQ